MPTRRQFLGGAARAGAGLALLPYMAGESRTVAVVNDVHSQLNATRVASIVTPHTLDELQRAIVEAKAAGGSISIAGGRHAMGGQQFLALARVRRSSNSDSCNGPFS